MSNPNELKWLHSQDIQTTDIELRKSFDGHMSRGEYKEAIDLLRSQEEQLRGKAFVADAITKIVTGILFLEDEYNTGVTLFLSELAKRYFDLIDQFKNMNQWNANIKYTAYNFVLYNSEVYLALTEIPVGAIPEDGGGWLKLGLIGIKGAPGTDVKIKYGWESNRDYLANDLIAYKGDLYVAQKPNKGVEPGTDEATWLSFLIVSKGRINVGVNPPSNPIQNTIWFKTSTDPLTATSASVGELFRYRLTGDWEAMYPTTFFTLVSDRNKYTPQAKEKKLFIQPNQWGLLNGRYIITYRDNDVLPNSLVEVSYTSIMTTNQFRTYSNLKMEVSAGEIRFSIGFRPNETIKLLVRIQ